MIHLIDGQQLGEPRNNRAIRIKVDWDDDKKMEVDVDSLEFVKAANEFIRGRMFDGLSGGLGMFEGIPHTIQFDDGLSFDGFLDLTNTELVGSEEVITKFVRKKGVDWLSERADSFSWQYLYDKGVLTSSDETKVPYVVNFIPDGPQLVLAYISIYLMTKETVENIDRLQTLANEFTGAISDATIIPPKLGGLLTHTLNLVSHIVYMAGMLIAIKLLIETVFENLYQPTRKHKGVTIKKLFQKGCEHLGLQLDSTLLNSEWGDKVYIPTKDELDGDNLNGFPLSIGPLGTFGDVIRVFKIMFNAEYWIQNGVFYFERVDFQQGQSNYIIPGVYTDQERLLDRYTPNADEIVSNYLISWRYDTLDQNTINEDTGMFYQVITSPQTVGDQDYVTLKGYEEVAIPFALGKRKNSLTALEEVLNFLGSVVDAITGIFGGGTNFSGQVQARIGTMNVSSRYIAVPKLISMTGNKLSNNQREVMAAKRIWDEFHYLKSFAESDDGSHNQWLIDGERRVPMTNEEFMALSENRFCTNQNGETVRIDSMSWNWWDSTTTLVARVNKKYTDNLKIETVE